MSAARGGAAKTDDHPVGACRMGHDELAVVDPASVKVRGLEGPRVLSSNADATTIIIGEKGADLIRERAPLPAVNLP